MHEGIKQGRLPGRGRFETETRNAKWTKPLGPAHTWLSGLTGDGFTVPHSESNRLPELLHPSREREKTTATQRRRCNSREGTAPAPISGVGATEIAEMPLGGSKERRLIASQLRKNSARGKARDRRLRRTGRLGDFLVVGKRGPHPENLVGCSFIIKGKVCRGEDHLPPLS